MVGFSRLFSLIWHVNSNFFAPTLALGPGGTSKNAVWEGGHFEEVHGPPKLLGSGCVWAQIKEEIQLIPISTKTFLKAFIF